MSALSGQTIVATAGTAVPLGTQHIHAPLMVKALASNSGLIYLGNNGNSTVDASSGLVLAAGESVLFRWVGCLASLFVDASADGQGVAWLALDV